MRWSVLAVLMLCARVTVAGALEPETGVFGGSGAPDPYELVLRQTLLEDDKYRLCQLVSMRGHRA